MLTAQAEAEKIRKIGEAEAASIEAVGKAEAEKMRMKAEAYQQYGEAAKTALVLEALPKVWINHILVGEALNVIRMRNRFHYDQRLGMNSTAGTEMIFETAQLD